VRVTAFGDRPPPETIDPLGDAFLHPAGWEAILSRVTVLRAL
jgi:hypothetical protein